MGENMYQKIGKVKRKQIYWFRVVFGKWDTDGNFDSESSDIFVGAWDAFRACKKAIKNTDSDGEIIISVTFLGYPQL